MTILSSLGGPKCPNIVWHYTNIAGFNGIVSNSSLWATAPQALNDPTEFKYGRDLIESEWRAIKASNPPSMGPDTRDADSLHHIYEGQYLSDGSGVSYVLCASTNADDLGQWRSYGLGYSIGLRTSEPLFGDGGASLRSVNQSDWMPAPGWNTVIYDENDQRHYAREVLRQAIALPPGGKLIRVVRTQQLLLSLAAILKHPSYAGEREVRHLSTILNSGPQLHRQGRYGDTPYVELTGSDHRLPIAGIVCAPGEPADADGEAERHAYSILQRANYSDIKICGSQVPYRR